MDEISWTRLTRVTLLSGLLALGVATIAPLPGATLSGERPEAPQARPPAAAADGAAAAIEGLGRELTAARRRIGELEAARAGGAAGDAAEHRAAALRATARVAELSQEVEAGWRWIEELNAVLASTCFARIVGQQDGAADDGRGVLGRDSWPWAPVLLARVMGQPLSGRP